MDMYTATEVAYKNGYEKGFTDGVVAILNKFQEPINMSQVWQLMSELAEKHGLEKVDGIYTVKEN